MMHKYLKCPLCMMSARHFLCVCVCMVDSSNRSSSSSVGGGAIVVDDVDGGDDDYVAAQSAS